MAKVFITGVAGFLGSHLADALIKEGHTVSGCDNLIGGYMDNVPENCEFHFSDCRDLNAMQKATQGVDVIYHAACTAYEGLSVFSPSFITDNTFQVTAATVSAAIQNKVKRYVLCSSMARYGHQDQLPFHENMEPKPVDPYGIAKLASEELVKNLAKVHGMAYAIAVPHNIIGTRQKYDDPYRNVASIMINLMLQGRQPVIYGDGNQMRCFTFVNDAISCLLKMGFDKQVVGEVINIGPDEEPVTINRLAKELADILDFKLDPIYVPDRPQEVRVATCSAEKARKLLGYKTSYTLRRGLEEMVDWVKMRGTKRFRYHLDLEIINEKTPQTWKGRTI